MENQFNTNTQTTPSSTAVSNNSLKNQKTTKALSIGIGVVISIVLLFIVFGFIQNTFIKAEDVSPRDVVVSEVSNNTAKITWATGRETQGVVEYGLSPTALNFFAPETNKSTSHGVDLTLLSPNTTYYFQIRIGEKKYDNGGAPWIFSTKTTGQKNTTIENTVPTQAISLPTPTLSVAVCSESDCEKIKNMLGNGCSSLDYQNCIKKQNATPDLIDAPKLTPTETPTPTVAP